MVVAHHNDNDDDGVNNDNDNNDDDGVNDNDNNNGDDEDNVDDQTRSINGQKWWCWVSDFDAMDPVSEWSGYIGLIVDNGDEG